MMEVDTLSPSV